MKLRATVYDAVSTSSAKVENGIVGGVDERVHAVVDEVVGLGGASLFRLLVRLGFWFRGLS